MKDSLMDALLIGCLAAELIWTSVLFIWFAWF
jgi:hypothetical protein